SRIRLSAKGRGASSPSQAIATRNARTARHGVGVCRLQGARVRSNGAWPSESAPSDQSAGETGTALGWLVIGRSSHYQQQEACRDSASACAAKRTRAYIFEKPIISDNLTRTFSGGRSSAKERRSQSLQCRSTPRVFAVWPTASSASSSIDRRVGRTASDAECLGCRTLAEEPDRALFQLGVIPSAEPLCPA